MLDVIIWIAVVLLACLGLVQLCTWFAIRYSRKGNRVYKIIPIGGAGKKAGDQMSLLYACMQWDSNPSRQIYVLYNVGLSEEEIKACEQLTKNTGAFFAKTPQELIALMNN